MTTCQILLEDFGLALNQMELFLGAIAMTGHMEKMDIMDHGGEVRTDNSTWIENGNRRCDYNTLFLCFMYN